MQYIFSRITLQNIVVFGLLWQGSVHGFWHSDETPHAVIAATLRLHNDNEFALVREYIVCHDKQELHYIYAELIEVQERMSVVRFFKQHAMVVGVPGTLLGALALYKSEVFLVRGINYSLPCVSVGVLASIFGVAGLLSYGIAQCFDLDKSLDRVQILLKLIEDKPTK